MARNQKSAVGRRSEGKRQVAVLTKKQLGFQIGQNILSQLSTFANGIRQILEKGIDPATKQALKCAPDDIKRSLSLEQLTAVEDFYTTFAVQAEEENAERTTSNAESRKKA